jgi:hypothetical protein
MSYFYLQGFQIMQARPVYILGSARTPFVKSMSHYRDVTTQEIMTTVVEQRTHLSMGQHCEKMVQEWCITDD